MNFDIPPDFPASPSEKNKKPKRIIVSVVAAISFALAGLGAYTWAQENEQSDQRAEVIQPQDETAATNPDESKTLTATLPNGKTAMYENTDSNRNITFLESDTGSDYVGLSHKAIAKYISSVDKSIVEKLCGANGELAERDDILVGTMSTAMRMMQYPTENSCLDELATMRNADASSRAKAVELVELVKTDVKQFYSTVIIK